ncbi:LysR family transcriptional regulator [Jiella sp. MQZ9-1]|uniref:LysR family transcriptional regulator n=1 Tax=Jiella flava TaxID=2816857 RepID=A0A939JUW9_9HYPH|nr:LysR family transcriptional regulator [Jiella flava]MBO0663590.1 LysR family transcriptional regulator [Jiella flava]MCD2472166.1 LysR family transcriptional regulator [Jiella flava]
MDRALLPSLSLFSTVARLRSFRAASRETGLSPSAVSHAVASLEASLGVRLLHRTTRSVSPTPDGEALLERLAPALAEISEAVLAAGAASGEPAGTLKVNLSRAAYEIVILPRLASFCAAHPHVTLDLTLDDGLADVASRGFDAGIRLQESIERDMICVPAGPPLSLAVVASPSYLAKAGRPQRPADLDSYAGIVRRFDTGPIYRWEFAVGGRTQIALPRPAVIVNDTQAAVMAALQGLGVTIAFFPQVAPWIAEGRLVRLLTEHSPDFEGFGIYYPSRRQMRPPLRAFIDHFRSSGASDTVGDRHGGDRLKIEFGVI